MKDKVFVVQHVPNFNYSKAKDYGDVCFILSHDDQFGSEPAPADHNFELMIKMKEVLTKEGYKAGTDYLLLSGSMSAQFAAGLVVSDFGNYHKTLKFDTNDRAYVELIVDR
jgi:hypothetical protein